MKFDPRTLSPLQYQIPSSRLILYYRSGKISYSNHSSYEIELFEVETANKIKLCGILEQLNQKHNRAESVKDFVEICIGDSEEQDLFFSYFELGSILSFLGGATSLDSFRKAYQTNETKKFFSFEKFACTEKLHNK